MKYQPKTEEEVNNFSLCPEGVFPFEVVHAEEKLSQKGNEMIQLKLKVFDDEGNQHIVYDFLMEAVAFKLKHFCDAVGLAELYKSGELTDIECEGKTGKVEIGHRPDQKDKEKMRHGVKDYIVDESANMIEDDDIPF